MTRAPASSARSFSSTSKPLMSSIVRSSSTRSGRCTKKLSMAAIPLVASCTTCPSDSTMRRCVRRVKLESSTIMMVAMSEQLLEHVRHLLERGAAIAQGRFHDRARHAVDDARRLGLGGDPTALRLDVRGPQRPSFPMPVITTPSTRGPKIAAADWKSTSTAGRWGVSVGRRSRWARTEGVGAPHEGEVLAGGANQTTPGRRTSPLPDLDDLEGRRCRSGVGRTSQCSRPACAGRWPSPREAPPVSPWTR
jgi:hypothetical protein